MLIMDLIFSYYLLNITNIYFEIIIFFGFGDFEKISQSQI